MNQAPSAADGVQADRHSSGSVAAAVSRALGASARWYRACWRSWYAGGAERGWPERWRALIKTSSGRVVFASSVAGLLLLLALGLALAKRGDPLEGPPNPLPAQAVGSGAVEAGRPKTHGATDDADRDLDQLPAMLRSRVQRARELVIARKCRAVLQQLAPVLNSHPEVARSHYYQGAALVCLHRDAEGLKHYAEAIRRDQRYVNDDRILADLSRMSRRSRSRGPALAFLCDHMGQAAAPLLLDLARSRQQEIRARAVERLRELGLEDRIDFARVLALDLDQTSSCAEREKIIEQLQDLGPPAIDVLRRARDRRTRVLGFLPGDYMHACVRKRIIEALDELAARRGNR